MPLSNKERQREYQRLWLAKRRERYIYLNGSKCRLCDGVDRLEFDHIDRSSKVSHRIWSWSIERIEIELSKCQLLCYNCHKNKTSFENSRETIHGTSNAYDSKKCRCLPCKLAKSKRNKLRRR